MRTETRDYPPDQSPDATLCDCGHRCDADVCCSCDADFDDRPPTTRELKREAEAADKAFQDALEAAYGADAGDRRYDHDHPDHPHIEDLQAAFQWASELWHASIIRT